ncbi:MAG: NUDIX hydrolase [Pseudomonadota bacterium]
MRTRQVPLKMGWASKSDVRTQFAALCYRRQGRGLQILLITGRRTKRWALPRGWPMNGLTPSEAAAMEAWEEGGAKGAVSDVCVGIYSYTKLHGNFAGIPCVVAVFPLKVKKLSDEFPEAGERERKWFSQKQAVARVDTPGLRQIIRHFNPDSLGQVSGFG